jgi:hypothetical protein
MLFSLLHVEESERASTALFSKLRYSEKLRYFRAIFMRDF